MNNLKEVKEAEKSCRDLLSTLYAIGDKKISVDVEDFLKEANKLKNVIEEGLQNYHVDKMAMKQSHPLAHKPILDDVYDALPEIPEEQRIVCFTSPWNPKGDTYLREWNRYYNGMGKPFTLPTKLIIP